jgi:phosphate starvation-inducible protein PhoH and related proteins
MHLENDHLFYGLGPTLTDEQKDYIDKVFNHIITFCNAPSGSGKTTLAVAMGHFLFELGVVDKVLYIFNPTEEGTMGHRPGTQDEKEEAYLVPLKDALVKINQNPENINLTSSWCLAKSHTFLRGTNIERYFVIIDEAQNYTKHYLKKTLTRIHDTSKAVVIGHEGQIDLKNKSLSGFVPFIYHFQGEDRAAVAHLTHDFRGWLSKHADSIGA